MPRTRNAPKTPRAMDEHERVLLHAIARRAEAFVDNAPGATAHALTLTVRAWQAWRAAERATGADGRRSITGGAR